jgi:hypothetical protein
MASGHRLHAGRVRSPHAPLNKSLIISPTFTGRSV